MVGTIYLTNVKLLLLPKDSKSRLLAALSCPNFIPIHLTFSHVHTPLPAPRFKRLVLPIRSAAAGDDRVNETTGETRLIRTIRAFRIKLIARLKEVTKNLPVKLFSFLVGFYCATAFATVIGQTGDWDVLSAALAVAVVEAIGALTYKASIPFKNFIIISNYWKVVALLNEHLLHKRKDTMSEFCYSGSSVSGKVKHWEHKIILGCMICN